LILDGETTGLDVNKDELCEVGGVLWSVEHRCILECFSSLVYATSNAAAEVNGIPEAVVQSATTQFPLRMIGMACGVDAIVAHNAEFDRPWFATEHSSFRDVPWICTIEDMVWPKPSPSRSLTAIALAHGVAVVSAHRAIHDCLLLARMLEVVPDVDERLKAALAHALLPKAEIHSLASFDEKDIVKGARVPLGLSTKGVAPNDGDRGCEETALSLEVPE